MDPHDARAILICLGTLLAVFGFFYGVAYLVNKGSDLYGSLSFSWTRIIEWFFSILSLIILLSAFAGLVFVVLRACEFI